MTNPIAGVNVRTAGVRERSAGPIRAALTGALIGLLDPESGEPDYTVLVTVEKL